MESLKSVARELWWVYVLQGIAMLLLGVVALFWPGLTLGVFLYAVALFGIVIGILDLIFGLVTIPTNRTWWLNVLSGIVFIGVAAYLLRHTDIALGTFAVIVGSIFIVRGVLETISAGLWGRFSESLLSVIGGILSVIVGIIIWVYPVSGSLSFVWVIGLFAIVRGAIDIAAAAAFRSDLEAVVETSRRRR